MSGSWASPPRRHPRSTERSRSRYARTRSRAPPAPVKSASAAVTRNCPALRRTAAAARSGFPGEVGYMLPRPAPARRWMALGLGLVPV